MKQPSFLKSAWSTDDERGRLWVYKKGWSFFFLFFLLIACGLLITLKLSVFIDLEIFSILSPLFFFLYICSSLFLAFRDNDEFSTTRIKNILIVSVVIVLGLLGILFAIELIKISGPAEDVQNAKNLADDEVEEFQTGLLAMYAVCCTEQNVSGAELSCDFTGNEEPCFRDEELFDEKVEDIGGPGSNRCKIVEGNGAAFYQTCDKVVGEFVHILARRTSGIVKSVAFGGIGFATIGVVMDLSLLIYFVLEERSDKLYAPLKK